MSGKDAKQYFQKPWNCAFASAMIVGFVTHLYALTNNLQNCDNIAQQPIGYGTGITSGRWLLSVMGDCSQWVGGNYNLPLVNGLLFLLLIAVSAGFLVSTLRIEGKIPAALIGGLMSVFPSVTATLFFRYTVVYYGFGVFFAVFAAWILPRHPWGIVASAVSIACSLGIYQAYIPITISILILVLIQEGMCAQADGGKMIRHGLYDCLALLLGLALYYLILQGMLKIYGASLSDYQGMDTMGRIPLTQLPALVKESVYSVVMLPIKDYHGLSGMHLIKVVYVLLAGITAVTIVYAMVTVVRKWFVALIQLVLCFLLLVAVNFIVIMCPESWIYTLMVYSFVLLPCVPLVFVQALAKQGEKKIGLVNVAKKGCIACVAVLVLSYGYEANIQYTMADYTGHQVENYMQSLVTQIRMTEGFTAEKRWAFLGQVQDPLMRSYWEYELRYSGAAPTMEDLLNRYSREEWIRNYLGYSPDFLEKDELESLAEVGAVKAMPCWPSQGSIQVIGDTVVVKFQDLEHMEHPY